MDQQDILSIVCFYPWNEFEGEYVFDFLEPNLIEITLNELKFMDCMDKSVFFFSLNITLKVTMNL